MIVKAVLTGLWIFLIVDCLTIGFSTYKYKKNLAGGYNKRTRFSLQAKYEVMTIEVIGILILSVLLVVILPVR